MATPGDLFAQLWVRLAPRAGAIIARPWRGRKAREWNQIVAHLMACATEDVPTEIDAYLQGHDGPFDCEVGPVDQRAFVVMCALDEAAMHVHPAIPRRTASLSTALGPMVVAMRARRTSEGAYADLPGIGMVAPKGHLMTRRRPNDAEDASGTDLAHQFEYLSFIAPLQNGLRLRFMAPPPSRLTVPPDRAERVGLAPIAEDRDDLSFEPSVRVERPYLDTLPSEPLLSDRIAVQVPELLDKGAGLVVLPELIAGPGSLARLQAALRGRGGSATPALILAGTGPTADICPDSGRPFNEASLITADGKVLYRQRKLHLFNMGAKRMRDCAITPASGYGAHNHMEDAAPGQELVVCDILGLGRVVVLICEDLEQLYPGATVTQELRPDWILTPVLDISQTVGRWTHARAIEIGRRSLSRVVVSCSATLGVRMAKAERLSEVTGDAINTAVCLDGHADLKFKLVEAAAPGEPQHRVLDWDSSTWARHKTGV
jgi:hypothetical protein